MITCPDGSPICFQAAPGYSPPTWPDATSSMQMHLDFDVDDLDATEARVLAAGASKYEFQPTTTAVSTPTRPVTPSACPRITPGPGSRRLNRPPSKARNGQGEFGWRLRAARTGRITDAIDIHVEDEKLRNDGENGQA
jgi:Glyoxalase-like domain